MPNYRVVFREEVCRQFIVDNCRTPEEAETIAEGREADGEEGEIICVETLASEIDEIEDEL